MADARAVFRFHEVPLGFLPGMATFRLTKYVGLGRAKNLGAHRPQLAAHEALEWGLVDAVYDAADFESALQRRLAELQPFQSGGVGIAAASSKIVCGESEDFLGRFLAASTGPSTCGASAACPPQTPAISPPNRPPWETPEDACLPPRLTPPVRYIAGLGSYSPGEPVPFARIEDVLAGSPRRRPSSWTGSRRMRPIMEQMLGVSYCHYAIDPQTRKPTDDSVSMSVKAAREGPGGGRPAANDIDLLVYAGIVSEYTCRPRRPSSRNDSDRGRRVCHPFELHVDLQGPAVGGRPDPPGPLPQRPGLHLAVVFAVPGRRTLQPEAAGQVAGAAPLVPQRRGRGRGGHRRSRPGGALPAHVETYIESMGLGLGPDMYCMVGGHRIHPLEVYENGWHHLTQNFDRVAKLGIELAKKAGDRMMERIGISWPEIRYMFMNVPTKHIHDIVVSDTRADKNVPDLQFCSKLAEAAAIPAPAPSSTPWTASSRKRPPARATSSPASSPNRASGCTAVSCSNTWEPPNVPAIFNQRVPLAPPVPVQRRTLAEPVAPGASVVAESSKWMYGGFVLEYFSSPFMSGLLTGKRR